MRFGIEHTMKIGVIGSGVSGLVSAHLLSRSHDVTIFESDQRIGGHVNTIAVDTADGVVHVDTGFIVFNEKNYPLFSKLLKELGVDSQSSRMSFSVKDERHGIEFSGSNLATLFAKKGTFGRLDHWRMLKDVHRFIGAVGDIAEGDPSITISQMASEMGLSDEFLERFLSPLGCALWSCPHGAFLEYPARFVAEFMRNHQLIDYRGRPEWRTLVGGSNRYVQALVSALKAEVKVSCGVDRIRRSQSQIFVEAGGVTLGFDEIVVAAHADTALGFLHEPSCAEIELLGAFPFQKNEAILHTDVSVLPENRKAWSSWNYRVPREELSAATVTYNMNILQSLATEETYLVSLNESAELDRSRILARFDYDHPISTVEGFAAKKRRSELIRHAGISYCGAYWGYGFHEDGVKSANEVGAAFGEVL
ncbi:MAG: NAD(P)/FAD-dependent oxidoreductase [Fimbriimonadaceae bacterium]